MPDNDSNTPDKQHANIPNDIFDVELQEENVTPIDVTPKRQEIEKSQSNNTNSLERCLSQIINLNNNNEVHEPTCAICSSACRAELEKMYDPLSKDEKQIKAVRDFFYTKTGIKISKGLLDNHVRFHVDNEIKEIQKIEYINRIQRVKNNSMTTMDYLDSAYAIILERIIGINSLPPRSGDLSQADTEKLKSTETAKLVGSIEHLMKLRATIMGEMKTNGEVITLPTGDFVRIFTDAIKNEAKSERERTLIMDILTKLRQIGH